MHNGVLPRASAVPEYARLATDPNMLANARYRKTSKREQCIGFVCVQKSLLPYEKYVEN